MSFAHEFYKQCLNADIFDQAIEKMSDISASTFAKIVSDCGVKVTLLQSSFNEADHREIFEFFSLVVEVSASTPQNVFPIIFLYHQPVFMTDGVYHVHYLW